MDKLLQMTLLSQEIQYTDAKCWAGTHISTGAVFKWVYI